MARQEMGAQGSARDVPSVNLEGEDGLMGEEIVPGPEASVQGPRRFSEKWLANPPKLLACGSPTSDLEGGSPRWPFGPARSTTSPDSAGSSQVLGKQREAEGKLGWGVPAAPPGPGQVGCPGATTESPLADERL